MSQTSQAISSILVWGPAGPQGYDGQGLSEILHRFEKVDVQQEPSRTFSSFVKGYTTLPVKATRK